MLANEDVRELHVEQDHVGGQFADRAHPRESVTGLPCDLEAGSDEQRARLGPEPGTVIHDQDASIHGQDRANSTTTRASGLALRQIRGSPR